MTYAKILLGATLLCSALGTTAIAANQQGYDGWSWSGNLDSVRIDKKVAERDYISDTAVAFGLAAEHYSSTSEFTYAIGLNFISYDDKIPFTQQTNHGRKSSDANGILGYVEFGPRYHFGTDGMSFFVVKGGVSGMFNSERGIGYCSNCYSEKIHVDGGLYGVLGVGHNFNSFDLALNFQQYFTGDIDNSISLKLSSRF